MNIQTLPTFPQENIDFWGISWRCLFRILGNGAKVDRSIDNSWSVRRSWRIWEHYATLYSHGNFYLEFDGETFRDGLWKYDHMGRTFEPTSKFLFLCANIWRISTGILKICPKIKKSSFDRLTAESFSKVLQIRLIIFLWHFQVYTEIV